MNISQSTVSFTSQASASQSRRQGPPTGGKEQLSSALESIGVDDSTAAKVLEQIDTAIATLESESSSGKASRREVRSVIDQVLESNGIDKGDVGEAIQSANASAEVSGTGEASRGERPRGPRPPRREDEEQTSAVESALVSAGVDESSTDELISQIIDTIGELTTESGSHVSQDQLRTALTSLFEENGVDFNTFEQALASELGSAGSFLDVLV